jgi:excisionase family DNA binding protein
MSPPTWENTPHLGAGSRYGLLTVFEAAAILRVGRNQLYQAVARGEVGAVRIGRSIRIPKQALLDLLAAASPLTASGDE